MREETARQSSRAQAAAYPACSLSHAFAQNVADTRYEKLSPEAIECAKKSVLETVGDATQLTRVLS